jgi:hypothetical protein
MVMGLHARNVFLAVLLLTGRTLRSQYLKSVEGVK